MTRQKTEAELANGQPTVEVVPIGDILPDASNVRRRDAETERMMTSSLRQFGPGRSIVLDGNDVVKAGNGTLKAAQDAGFTEILKVRPEPGQLVAVVRDDWSPTEATAYAIADNRLSDRASFDEIGLAEIIRGLQSEDFDISSVGFTSGEVDDLLKKIGNDLIDVIESPEDFPEKDESIDTDYCCPKCGYEWSGKPS